MADTLIKSRKQLEVRGRLYVMDAYRTYMFYNCDIILFRPGVDMPLDHLPLPRKYDKTQPWLALRNYIIILES